jgi:hypothetical protein
MADPIIDRIVESLAVGAMSVDEFMRAVEKRTHVLYPAERSCADPELGVHPDQ